MSDHKEIFTAVSQALIDAAETVMETAPPDFSHEDLANVFLASTTKMFASRIGIEATADHLRNLADGLNAMEVSDRMKKH